MDYTVEELERLDLVPVTECELSVRTVNCFINHAKFEPDGVAPTLGVFARMTREARMRLPNYGRKSEREFVEVVDYFLRRWGFRGGTPDAPVVELEPLHPYAWPIYQQFLNSPVYANLTYRDIANRAFGAAREYRYVKQALERVR